MPLIPLSQPDIGPLERQYVEEVLASSRLALGPWLRRFEHQMAEICETKHAVAVSSGTAALHLITHALHIETGDEVITSPLSFVASSNAILYEGAVPRFVDISPDTLNLDVSQLDRAVSPATKSILAVDVFGIPADWPALAAFAEAHGFSLIDDACEALGARSGGRALGSWGHAAAFGFYPNKQITTGEGGCITTNADDIADLCRSLRNQGRADDARMEHVHLGYNYRMDELSAAVGCAQLERFAELQARRSDVAAWYRAALEDMQDDLVLPPEPGDRTRSWFVYVVRLKDHFTADARDRLMAHLGEAGIGCAPYFPCIHLQPYYRRRFGYERGAFPIAEAVSDRSLALPFFTGLKQEEVSRVAMAVRQALSRLPRTRQVTSF